MHIKTMEGLGGAWTKMEMVDGPKRQYQEGMRELNAKKIGKSLDHVNQFEAQAKEYMVKAGKGLMEQAAEMREQQKEKLEETIENRRDQREEMQTRIEERRQNLKDSRNAKDTKEDENVVRGVANGRDTKDIKSNVSKSVADRRKNSGSSTRTDRSYSVGSKSDVSRRPFLYTKSGGANRNGQSRGFTTTM